MHAQDNKIWSVSDPHYGITLNYKLAIEHVMVATLSHAVYLWNPVGVGDCVGDGVGGCVGDGDGVGDGVGVVVADAAGGGGAPHAGECESTLVWPPPCFLQGRLRRCHCHEGEVDLMTWNTKCTQIAAEKRKKVEYPTSRTP